MIEYFERDSQACNYDNIFYLPITKTSKITKNESVSHNYRKG